MVQSVMLNCSLNLFALACSRFCKTHAVNKSWAWHDTLLSLSMSSMLLLVQGSTQEQVVTCHIIMTYIMRLNMQQWKVKSHAHCVFWAHFHIFHAMSVHVLDTSHHLHPFARSQEIGNPLLGQEYSDCKLYNIRWMQRGLETWVLSYYNLHTLV